MYRCFKDETHSHTFREDGFLVVPLLDDSEILELTRFYRSLANGYKTPFGFHVSMDDKDPQFIKTIHEKAMEICLPRLEDWLRNFRAFSGRFLVKDPHRRSIVTPHQDWSFVNETDSCSAIVWIALVDVAIHNGALGVLRGSHLLNTGYRASPLPIFEAPYQGFAHKLFSRLDMIPMKKGEAMIMDNRLVHGSPPNLSNKDRLVMGFEITHSESQLLHYFLAQREGRHCILKYNIDDTFFYNYSNAKLRELYKAHGEIQDYPLLEELEYNQEKWDEELFWGKLGNVERYPKNEKLQQLFDYSYGHTDEIPVTNGMDSTLASSHKKGKSFLGRMVSWIKN